MALQTVSLKQAAEMARKILKANLVPYLAGSPGVGKSAVAQTLAKHYNLKLIDIRLSQEDPTCLNGFPELVNGRSSYAPPTRFPLERKDKVPSGYNGWLVFFDELPSAPRSVQAASYKIILDRLIGEHPLHSKVYIMAAGNLTTDNAVANEMGTALRSRMIHIPVASNPDCWLDYAAKAGFDTRVISYLTYQTSKINNFKHFEGSQDETFACERTWEFVSKLLKANCPDATQPVPEDMTALLAGTVGSIAYEFVTYTEAFKDLPSLQDVLKNSLQCPIPTTPAVRFLMMGMLVGSATLENANTIGEYVDRFPKEFGMIFVKMLWGKSDKFLSIPSIDLLLNKVADMLHN